jgi:hypothetical protein
MCFDRGLGLRSTVPSVGRVLACHQEEARRSGPAAHADAGRSGRALGCATSGGFGLWPKPREGQARLTPRPALTLTLRRPAGCQVPASDANANRSVNVDVPQATANASKRGGCCHVSDVGI